MSSIVMLSYGRNAYDHTKDVEHDTYYGSFIDDPARQTVYMNRAEQYMARSDTGWYSMIEINTKTGESKVWFLRENPLKTRVELNIPAKEAQAIKKVRKLSTLSPADFLEQINGTIATPTSVWMTHAPQAFTVMDDIQHENSDTEF